MADIRTEEMLLNMGPQHPSTHGVFRVVIRTDGEMVLESESHIGYLHRCFEKVAENNNYLQVVPYTDRMDYLCAMANNLGYAQTVEKLMKLQVPERAEYIRVIVTELNRIASHLMAFGTYGMDLGAVTPFLYAFRDREMILKIFEKLCGQRLNYSYVRVGGVTFDITDEILADIDRFCTYFEPDILQEYNDLLSYNGIFISRTANVGVLPVDLAISYGVTGPSLRGSGVKRDLRKDEPFGIYDQFEFEVPIGKGEMGTVGDCWDRYMVRVREMTQSVKIVRQALKRIPAGDFCDKKAFRGVKPPKGEVYHKIEGARGEVGFYLVSDGSPKPYRVKARGPSFCNISVLDALTSRGDCMVADMVALIGSLDIVMGEVDRVIGFLAQAVPSVEELARQRATNPTQGGLYLESWFHQLVDRLGYMSPFPEWALVAITLLIVCVIVFGFINVFALFAVWAERKVSAHMQCRLGPMEVGPHGILQTIADGIKLTAKEDIIPRLADKPLFILAPIIVFTGILIRFVPLPFGQGLVASDLDLGLFFVAAVGSVEVIGVIMGAWASNNKWSLFGAIRTATQMVSYEVPIGIAFVAVIACAGSFSMIDIVNQQQGWVWDWYVFQNPFLLVLSIAYLVASLAECKRAPFDLPEAESELVSGYFTEYSGMRFGLFFLSEYAAMYLVSAVAVALFLGGWWTGIKYLDDIGLSGADATLATVGFLLKAGVFVSKSVLLVIVQIWVRWTLPRVRLDQMMHLCWKVLMPISLASLVGATIWQLASGGVGLYGLGGYLDAFIGYLESLVG